MSHKNRQEGPGGTGAGAMLPTEGARFRSPRAGYGIRDAPRPPEGGSVLARRRCEQPGEAGGEAGGRAGGGVCLCVLRVINQGPLSLL